MSYEHHVFISYARIDDLWTVWVREQFAKRLKAYLDVEIVQLQNSLPSIFADDQIQTGARWEQVLKNKIARSSVMVCLLSASYFQSEWCRRELALMLEREQHCGIAGCGNNYGLVIPVRIGDGDYFPDLVRSIQFHDFENYADLDLPRHSQRASDFNTAMKDLAKTVANTIAQAYEYHPNWLNFTGDDFIDVLVAKPISNKPPRFVV